MVKIMENPYLKMDGLVGIPPYFWKHPLKCPKSKNQVAQICSLAKVVYLDYIDITSPFTCSFPGRKIQV